MKQCTKCKQDKPLEEFFTEKKSKGGYMSRCKSCISIIDSPEAKKVRRLKFLYNLTLDQVEEMYNAQEGKCKICKVYKPTYNTFGGLVIDHCHATGKVRGLLCTNCNILLGRANDNPELLLTAIEYLKGVK